VNVLGLHNLIKKHGFIAGGACLSLFTNTEIHDIDVFCRTPRDYAPLHDLLMKEIPGDILESRSVFRKGIVQLMKPINEIPGGLKKFGSPLEVVSSYDFSVCRAWFDDSGVRWLDDDATEHVRSKLLVIKNGNTPESTKRRVLKYEGYGYRLAESDE
jgi:hypothetical protein